MTFSVQLPTLLSFLKQGDSLCPLWFPTYLRPGHLLPGASHTYYFNHISQTQLDIQPSGLSIRPAHFWVEVSSPGLPAVTYCPAALRPSVQGASYARS